MRELKFKTWGPKFRNMSEPMDMFYLTDCRDPENHGSYFEDDVVFLQYTGLIDKNGKEIYEGDIAMCDGKRRVIRWSNGRYWFHAEFADIYENISELFDKYYQKVEIIGNIYQNPELLK